MFEILRLSELNKKIYKDFLLQFDRFTSFASYEWLQCIEASYEFIKPYVVIEKDIYGGIRSILPFVLKSKYGIVICESMAFGTYGGVFSLDDNEEQMIDYLYLELKKKYNFFEIRIFNYGNKKKYILTESERNNFKCIECKASIINLKDGYENVYANYKHNVRKNIRKAEKENVIIKDVENIDEISEFYNLAKYTYDLHNSSIPYTLNLYKNIYRCLCLNGMAQYKFATRDGNIIAASLHFFDKNESFNWLTPSYRKYQIFRGNTLLIDSAIKDACLRGINRYNLGASPDGAKGLLSFKHHWGANDVAYDSFIYENKIIKILNRIRRE